MGTKFNLQMTFSLAHFFTLFVDVTIYLIWYTSSLYSHVWQILNNCFTVCCLQYVLYSDNMMMCPLQCQHDDVPFTLSTCWCALYSVNMMMCPLQCQHDDVPFTVSTWWCALYSVNMMMCPLQCQHDDVPFSVSTWWCVLYSVNMMLCPLQCQCYIVLYSVDVGLFQRQCQLVSSCGAGRSHDGAPQQRWSIHLQCSSRH